MLTEEKTTRMTNWLVTEKLENKHWGKWRQGWIWANENREQVRVDEQGWEVGQCKVNDAGETGNSYKRKHNKTQMNWTFNDKSTKQKASGHDSYLQDMNAQSRIVQADLCSIHIVPDW